MMSEIDNFVVPENNTIPDPSADFRVIRVGHKTTRYRKCEKCGADITHYGIHLRIGNRHFCIQCAMQPFLNLQSAPTWKRWAARKLGL